SGVGIIEFTNVSVGRGTDRPFEWIGAPWIDSRKLAAELNAKALPGLKFVPTSPTPSSSKHQGKERGGDDIIIGNSDSRRPAQLGLTIATTVRAMYPNEWDTKSLNTLLLHKESTDAILAGKSAAEIEAKWQDGLEAYRERRKQYLLYEE